MPVIIRLIRLEYCIISCLLDAFPCRPVYVDKKSHIFVMFVSVAKSLVKKYISITQKVYQYVSRESGSYLCNT